MSIRTMQSLPYMYGAPTSAPIPSSSLVPSDEEQSAKRKRIALSCSECKRRKIRCSKTTPCTACMKRGDSASCQPEFVRRQDSVPTNSSPNAELHEMRARLTALESFVYGSRPLLPLANPAVTTAARADPDSDTEEAAVILEDMSAVNTTSGQVSMNLPGSSLLPFMSGEAYSMPDPAAMAKEIFKTSIIRLLPDDAMLESLVSYFNSSLSWFWHITCTNQIDTELREFLMLRQRNDTHAVDVAWIGLLFSVLHQSVKCLARLPRPLPLRLPQVSSEDCARLGPLWYEGCKASLYLAEAWQRPQIRCIQTMLLFGPGSVSPTTRHEGTPVELSEIWRTAATRLARMLGLDKLGTNSNIMPTGDRSLPPGNSSISRQTGARIWWHLVFLDWVKGSPSGMGQAECRYLIPADSFDTAQPLNLNDSDLGFQVEVQERPIDVWTDSTFTIVKTQLATNNHKVQMLKARGEMNYATMLSIEENLRKLAMLYHASLSKATDAGSASSFQNDVRANLGISGVNNRVLRLHRPYLHRAFKNSEYSNSIRTCVEAAYRITECFPRLYGDGIGQQNFVILHNLTACITLATVLFCTLELPAHDRGVLKHREHMKLALDTFNLGSRAPDNYYSKLASHAANIVSTLLKVEAERRSGFNLITSKSGPSVASVFKQVASTVQLDEEGATPSGHTPSLLSSNIQGSPHYSNASTSEDETTKLLAEMGVFLTPSQGSTTAGKNQLAAETEMVDFNNVPLDWGQLMFGFEDYSTSLGTTF